MLALITILVCCYPNSAWNMNWKYQIKSIFQLILSPMLVILMEHAAGWTMQFHENLPWLYPKHWNITPIHSLWSQASSCNHKNCSNTPKLTTHSMKKMWTGTKPHSSKNWNINRQARYGSQKYPYLKNLPHVTILCAKNKTHWHARKILFIVEALTRAASEALTNNPKQKHNVTGWNKDVRKAQGCPTSILILDWQS